MTEGKAKAAETSNPPVQETAPKEAFNAATKQVEERVLLATYVDQLTPDNYTVEAKSTLLFEVRQFAEDVVAVTKMRRRADRDAEKILRIHVLDSASFLRNKKDDLGDKLADWSKWIGFTFIGFAVAQWIHIKSENPIVSGSVGLLVLDVIIAAILIVVGFMIDKPYGYFTGRFRRR
jgi:hypothetical protein